MSTIIAKRGQYAFEFVTPWESRSMDSDSDRLHPSAPSLVQCAKQRISEQGKGQVTVYAKVVFYFFTFSNFEIKPNQLRILEEFCVGGRLQMFTCEACSNL